MSVDTSAGTSRRDFLGASALLAGGVMLGGRASAAAELPKRTLGRTGLEVTTISFGAMPLNSPSHARVLEHAIERGVNLVHVSSKYQQGKTIAVVGDVMSRRRDQVWLALKDSPGDPNFDEYLKALNTDYVDLVVPPLRPDGKYERIIEAFEQKKAAGKVRHLGFAAHSDMAQVIALAAATGKFEACLCNYNIGNRDELNPVLRAAVQDHQVGFLIMKGGRGLPGNDQGQWQAGVRNLLANEDLCSLTLGQASLQQIDGNLDAVLQRDARADLKFALGAPAVARTLCGFCGKCAKACPRGVAVLDYLRADLYRDRGDLALARELTRSIPARHSLAACHNCDLCGRACPKQLDVKRLMRRGCA